MVPGGYLMVPGGYLNKGVLLSCSGQLKTTYLLTQRALRDRVHSEITQFTGTHDLRCANAIFSSVNPVHLN